MEFCKTKHGTVWNFVFADDEGNIGFCSPGAVPNREHPIHGSFGI